MSLELPVSVVIPAYNAEPFLREALESVAAQTRRPAEVIVVDDGSQDRTAQVAREWGARVVVRTNGGTADARNAGIRVASAPWIALLDADDRWLPERLAAQWMLHERAPEVRLVAGDYQLSREPGSVDEPVLRALRRYRAIPHRAMGGGSRIARADLLAALVEGNFLLPSTWLVERSLFSEPDAYFCERRYLPASGEYFIGEDYEWLLRAVRFTDVLVVERPLVVYRRTPSSLSAHGARMRYGDVRLGRLVCAAPERYAAGAAQGFARVRPRQLRDAGMRFLASGDVAAARRMFAEALRAGPHVRSLALYAMTAPFVGGWGVRAFALIFAMWRANVRPILRGIRRCA